jgi:hypothetical protein
VDWLIAFSKVVGVVVGSLGALLLLFMFLEALDNGDGWAFWALGVGMTVVVLAVLVAATVAVHGGVA